MALALTTPLHVARHLVATDQAWLLLVEVDTGSGFFRLVHGRAHATVAGLSYQAAAIGVETPEQDGEGTLGEAVLTVPNVARIAGAFVESDAATHPLLGRTLVVRLAHESDLSTAVEVCRHTIVKCEVTAMEVRITAGHPAALLRVPQGVVDRRTFPGLPTTAEALISE